MSPIIAGLGLIVLGLVSAFFGYRIFRVLLPIYGGVAGFLLAWGWWGQSAWLLALIVGVVLAVVFAVLAYAFWSAMIAFGGLIMGGAIGIAIGTSLNLWGWLTALVAIGLAIVFAALFFWIRNEMVIILTALMGGTFAARGVGELFGWRSGLEGNLNSNPAWLSILVLAVGIVLFVAGLLYQWRAYAKLRWYDSKGGVPPAPAVAKPAADVAASRTAATIDMAAGPMGGSVLGSGAVAVGAAAGAAVVAEDTSAAAEVVTETAVEDADATVVEAKEEVAPTADEVENKVEEVKDATAEAAAGAGEGAAGVVAATAVVAAATAETGEEEVSEAGAEVTDAGAAVAAAAVVAEAADQAGPEGSEAAVDAVAAAGEDENKVEDIAEGAAVVAAVDADDNKVAKVLADLEKQFEGLEESAKFKEALEFVEGIGPAYAGKLKEVGVNNVLDLLRKGATRRGRVELTEASGISGKLILEWVNHADLYRIKGVGSEFADLLEAAGVDTVPELAQRNPDNLLQKMMATNEEKRLVRRAPHPSDVQDWVTQAKALPRIVQY